MKLAVIPGGWPLRAAAAALALAWGSVQGAAPPDPAPSTPAKGAPAMLEKQPDGTNRITLTEKAMQRLGIVTGKVSEQAIVRRQVVGGLVVAHSQVRAPQPAQPGFGGFSAPAANPTLQPVAQDARRPAAGETWVLVTLSHGEWERLAKAKPARLMSLETRAPLPGEGMAQPSGVAPIEDGKRSMLGLYYVMKSSAGAALEPNRRVRVELEVEGSGQKHKVVPYSAVYYDPKGVPWLFLNPEPRVFQRTRIALDRIAGDWAVLSEGPPPGTAVVTTGAPLLYGVEVFKK